MVELVAEEIASFEQGWNSPSPTLVKAIGQTTHSPISENVVSAPIFLNLTQIFI